MNYLVRMEILVRVEDAASPEDAATIAIDGMADGVIENLEVSEEEE